MREGQQIRAKHRDCQSWTDYRGSKDTALAMDRIGGVNSSCYIALAFRCRKFQFVSSLFDLSMPFSPAAFYRDSPYLCAVIVIQLVFKHALKV